MIVVSDTSPITALLTAGGERLLPELFGTVLIPPAVRDELLRGHPQLPVWLEVKAVQDNAALRVLAQTLDEGEAEAIELARELRADWLLMDERKGRAVAVRAGLSVIGLVGVVLLAKKRRLIVSARGMLDRLESEAGIYLARDVKDAALKSVGE